MRTSASIDEAIARTEEWFVKRGLPHFIAEYSASRDVLTRAAPVLTLIFLAEVLNAPKRSFPIWLDVLALAGGFALLLGAWMVVNRIRHLPLLARPADVGIFEVAVFVLAPAVIPALFGAQLRTALVTAAANVLLLAGVYVVTSYGFVPMTRWAAGFTLLALGTVVGLFVRAMPLLLLFVTFLFLTNEVWQVGRALVGPFYWMTIAFFPLIGMVFAIIRLPRELRGLSGFESWDTLVERAHGTPAETLVPTVSSAWRSAPELSRREWGNVGLVVLFSQGLQVVLVSAMLLAVLVLFGTVAVTEPVTKGFLGDSPHVLATIHLWGRTMVVTEELVRVAGFLASFSGFYFTVSVLTDDAYRDEFLTDVVDEVGRALAVRAIYRAALDRRRSVVPGSTLPST